MATSSAGSVRRLRVVLVTALVTLVAPHAGQAGSGSTLWTRGETGLAARPASRSTTDPGGRASAAAPNESINSSHYDARLHAPHCPRLPRTRLRAGRYVVRLVEGRRLLASSPLRIDQTAPRITRFRARNRSRLPFQGDKDRVTTISPNGDGLRESAKISFTLSERARVHFEVTRTVSAPETIYALTANLRPGRNTFTWHPRKTIGARTYLLRVTAVDGAGNRRTYGADNARTGRRLASAVVRVLGV